MSPRLATYPTWKEMFGKHPAREELLDQIRPLNRLHTLWLLARINLFIALDHLHDNSRWTAKLQAFLVNLLVDDSLFGELKKKFGPRRLEECTPFHSLQILTLMKLVAVESEAEGGLRPDANKEAANRLGRGLMMANDFLFTPEYLKAIRRDRPSLKKKRIALLLQVGSGLEVNNPPRINAGIVRSEIIFNEMISKTQCSLDIRGLFQKRSGMSLEDYVDHIFGVLAYYITLDTGKLLNDPGPVCMNTKTFFAEGSKELAAEFWEGESISVNALATALAMPSELRPYHDFIAFRKRPFLEVESANVIPIHLGFVQEKLESGLFWTVFNSLETPAERSALFTDWGHLFEGYVSELIGKCFAGSNATYHPFPKFEDNGDEAFDGVVVEGKYWVVMEYKGGFLTAKAKYAEDEEEFIRDVDKKFGRAKGAGIEQLARKLGTIFSSAVGKRRSLVGIDPSNAKIVIPVLIVQESFISSEITAPYLADEFASMKHKLELDDGVYFCFPLIIDVSEFETLKPYLTTGKISFIDCLMERVKIGGSSILSFRDYFREYLQRQNIPPIRDEELVLRFREIMNRISLRFFKKPFEAPNE
jgi:hypothetical protein